MATCTDSGASTSSTSNTTSYASASFTPSANDLLVVFVTATGTVLAAPTLTDSLGAITFTLVNQSLWSTSANSTYVFVANQLAAASARTVTFDCTGDAATGCIVMVCLVSGMTKTGATAVRQQAVTNNGASGTTPTLTFPGVALTANPTLAMIGSGATLPARPTGYTAGASVAPSYSTPTTLANYEFLNSGDTLTTITWAANASGVYGLAGVELDSSASGTNFNQSLSGSVTSTAALTTHLSALHSMSASVTTSASIVKQISHSMSASVVSSAAIIKKTAKSLSASVTTSAAIALSKVLMLAMSASTVCSAAMSEALAFGHSMSASVTSSAALATTFIAFQASTIVNKIMRGLWNGLRRIASTGLDND